MPSIHISQGSTMFLTKESILKGGSFLPILLQSETMFLFPGYFLGSRRTLENLFVHTERAWNGVVFHTKISTGNHCAFAGERLKYSWNSIFFLIRVLGDSLKDWFRVTEHPAAAFRLAYSCMRGSRFYCQDFLGWSDESYRLHAPLLPTLVSAKPVHAMTHERHFFLHSNCKGFGHW